MERTRTGIIASIIDTIKAFGIIETDSNGKIDEGKLNSEEKKELAKIREMDQVEKLEERTSFRKKYGATVDAAEANKNAKKAVKEQLEKTIESK